MNPVVEEMLIHLAIGSTDNPVANDILVHYGMPRRSGRYPWGSGDNPYQRGQDFLARVEELKKQGWVESAENIREEFGLTTSQYRTEKSIAKNERRMYNVASAKAMRDDGISTSEIARKFGVNESTVRSWFEEKSEARMLEATNTANFLKEQVDSKGMIDVGSGVELELNISAQRLEQALYILEREGYPTYKGGIPQLTNANQQTNQKVLCPPGTEHKDIYNYDEIHTITEYASRDGGDTFTKFQYPASLDSKRLQVRYAEDGGDLKDGIIELRRGVDDISLGSSKYAQVRILVDGDRYLKGMAVYSDNMPDGVDVIFNTNKTKDVEVRDVLKKIKDDPDNPFGTTIKPNGQSTYFDKDGNEKLSLINKKSDEGDWTEWKDALPSQFLGKQSRQLAQKQLDIAKADKKAEYEEIMSLNNPTIKKKLLNEFADNCDAAAVNLQAAALPGQKYHVIIPVNSLKDNEVYAPQYDNGTKVALIRYPHGGTFEIPILTVNNKHAPAKELIGNTSIDAIGITKKNADRLSGADYDGDTVMVIPTNSKVKITSTRELEGLKGFDPKLEYGTTKVKGDDGSEHYYRNGREVRIMKNTGTQMGVISNLITDMTLAGASEDKLARAVRHSMVVIDAEKHKLDYKQSEIDNNIAALKKEYQSTINPDGTEGRAGGASTILSRAKGQQSVDKRQGSAYTNIEGTANYDPTKPEGAKLYKTADPKNLYKPKRTVNKETGIVTLTTEDGKKIKYDPKDKEAVKEYAPVKKVDKDTGDVIFTNKSGTLTYSKVKRTQESTRMAETDDAYKLVSDARHPMELIYADYANSMKALANQARKEAYTTPKLTYSKSAAETYKKEVADLEKKLDDALLNSPKKRAALRIANAEVISKKKTYLEEHGEKMPADEAKKLSQQAVARARDSVGVVSRKESNIIITDREWEAIQAGAIHDDTLKKILNNTDTDALKQRAMPRTTTSLTPAKIQKAKAMSATYSLNEIAEALGVSPSTVSKALKGVN